MLQPGASLTNARDSEQDSHTDNRDSRTNALACGVSACDTPPSRMSDGSTPNGQGNNPGPGMTRMREN